ncbi:oxygen-independent coproporphyrinogen III oxidase [Clostridium sp. NSJ-49]|uniref:Heme chaperone HemW n=1 Tax=Clostridium disporicum TaxID=84024 RepID=A0A174JB39_9CLOT|nr:MULTISPECIES: radical SAM family heme chaperone HemW [Clostridium]MBC5624774.1 oxygen-independent coproporphyrinogen III oxidase [Clostridium sp. NSJ-49]MCD2502483.1 radical SAM family heme chaperone HemW [Clostridium sp. NSJ-145]MDU6341406.1 radical SAM family heme chaperone HemW [Clostridium sp.]CUO96904.1 coproporphyrinogen III oxidase [Clostridium disporicum]
MKEISLYIHIPFCKQKCFYCDFPSYSGKERFKEDYVDALIEEIEKRARGYIIKTIFIGGGTPSYLEVNQIEKLLLAINKLNLHKDIEFSMECNPGVLFKEKLIAMKNGGVNRISFGLQSTKDSLLKEVGRIHSYEEFLDNFKLARELGFKNINVDIMYGLPNQTVEDWKDTLETICSIKPEHISAYSLIIEEGTVFYNLYEKGLLKLPTEEMEREMDKLTKGVLKDHGYHQYEISNYSLDGKECEHNKVYWQLKDYIGLGTAASSYIDGTRIKNIDNIEEYISKINSGIEVYEEKYINSEEDEIEEFIFMGLRMNKGISIKEFEERFNMSVESIYEKVLEKNIKNGFLKKENGRIYLTSIGMDFSNNVMAEFILDK